MALKVWLPLTGTLENKGISNVTITNNSATISTSGKIGSCYAFNGSSKITATGVSIPAGQISASAWVYFDTNITDAQYIISLNAGGGFVDQEIGLAIQSSSYYFVVGGNSSCAIGTPILNTWTHMAVTFDGTTIRGYINGVLVKSVSSTATLTKTTFTIGARNNGGTNYTCFLKGRVNDVRIYDHCLSAAEVHEISQALAVHYKLDDITDKIYDSSGYGYNGTIIGTPTLSNNTPRYTASMQFNGTDAAINCGRAFHVQQAQAMTWSVWAYVDNWTAGTFQYFLSSQQSGGILLQIRDTNTIRARAHVYTAQDLSTTAYIQADCTAANSGITSGWHMLTGVYTTSNIKLYIDGQLKKTSTTTSYGMHFHDSASMFLAAESAGTIYYSDLCNCKLSDVRIYYTALSDTDILALYNTGAKADNLQNIHTFELNEIKDILQKEVATLSTSGTSNSQVIANYSVTGPSYPTTRYNQIYCPTNTFVTEQVPIKTGVEYSVTITGPKIFNITYNYQSSYWVRTSSGWVSVQDQPTYGMYVGYKIQAQFYDDEGDMVYTQSFNDTYIHQTNRSSSYNQTLYTYGDQTHTIIVPIKKPNLVSVRIAVTCCGSTNVRPTGKIYLLTHKNKIYKTGEFTAMYFKEDTNAKIYNDTSVEAAEFVEF